MRTHLLSFLSSIVQNNVAPSGEWEPLKHVADLISRYYSNKSTSQWCHWSKNWLKNM